VNSALAAASLSCSDTFETVPFPLEGITSPLGLEGEMDRRLRVGGDGERSRGTGVRDLSIRILCIEQECITYRFLLDGPSGLGLLDADPRGYGERDTEGDLGMLTCWSLYQWTMLEYRLIERCV
jgi:hypothetical protein